MRLNPGITLEQADEMLRRAEATWIDARGAQDFYRAYTDAVHDTYPLLKQAFATPDVAAGLRSTAYWNLLRLGARPNPGLITEAAVASSLTRALRAENNALTTEIANQIKALEQARAELKTLMELALRPGLPVIYDTNMLNHWRQPCDIRWREVFKDQGEKVPLTRLVVPLRVIDELDKQKYGPSNSDLARKAATAIRYLERVLKDSQPGEQVELRPDAKMEIWVDTDDRASDADMAILLCAADLAKIHPTNSVRVLTDDFGMRLRAQQMGLKVLRLPDDHRKKGTALDHSPS